MIVISAVGQKGGTGKSSISRLLAVNYAKAGWDVRIADLDANQKTSVEWAKRRKENGFEPDIDAEYYSNPERAIRYSQKFDVLIIDGRPYSSGQTLAIAKVSDAIIIPCSTGLDDLVPSVNLAFELVNNGIDKEKIIIVFARAGTSEIEIEEARRYIKGSGFKVAPGYIPEKTSIRRCHDFGQCSNETTFESVNQKSEDLINEIVKLIH